MQNKIPESYFIYQEFIRTLAQQKGKLNNVYLSKINEMSQKLLKLRARFFQQNEIIRGVNRRIKNLDEKLK